ncbi:MAG: hypothetical protein VYE17_06835 [Pseudomonadota bacterium]|nr:hypothetical protein [Pseudomonadota bacterium]
MPRIQALCALLLLLPALSLAQDAPPTFKDVLDTGEKSEAVIAEALENESLQPGETPLSTLLAIMDAGNRNDWESASQYLDMRYLPADMANADPTVLMEQLAIVWGQQRVLDLTRLSNEPQGHQEDGLRQTRHPDPAGRHPGPVPAAYPGKRSPGLENFQRHGARHSHAVGTIWL